MPKFFSVLFFVLFSFTAIAQQNMLSEFGNADVTGTATYEPSDAPVVFLDQLPNQVNGLFADANCLGCGTLQQSIADNFTVAIGGPTVGITEIVMWGGYFPENIPNTTDNFSIVLHDDNAGEPGTVLDSRTGLQATTRATTGIILFGVDEYVFTFDLSAAPMFIPSAGTYWVEIFNNSVESSNFFWETGDLDATSGILGSAWITSAPGVPPWNLDGATDLAIQINGDDNISGGPTCTWLDDFTAGTSNWIITNDGGTCVWDIFDASEYTLGSTGAAGNVLAADADACGSGSTTLTTATLDIPIDATNWLTVMLDFDHDWQAIDADDFAMVDVSTDGGSTWQNVVTYDVTDVRDTHESFDISGLVAQSSFIIRLVSIQPGWDWWWAVDNICVFLDGFVPVELSSFTAAVSGNDVTLNWVTATETNNQGFEIERNSGSGFQNIGYVAGFGTSLEAHSYSFVDASLSEGTHTYRLKQLDLDGTFEYSDAVEVDVTVPDVFALEQNYPNPFNPSTKINFSLAVDSKVSLKVFDVLGQEVATLISSDLVAGSHNIDFNAASINSGVYFYRIEATGIDGTNFTNVKKMILTK